MKRIFASVLICSLGALAFAGDGPDHGKHERARDPLAAEMEAILEAEADTVISDLTFGEIGDLMAKLSVPMQEAEYIKRSSAASMMMPGKGQFMNGDTLSGALFLAGDLVATAGALVGMYFLLPAELQFDQLDYFNTPHSDIEAAWQSAVESATFMDALPTLGVMAGGMALHHGIRAFSAKHAARLARENIEQGNVTFEPRTSFFTSGHGRLGIGMGMRF